MIKLFNLIVQLLFILVVVGGLGYGVYWFLTNDQQSTAQAQFQINEKYADNYYNRIQTYRGLCSDINLPAPYVCADSDTAYRIYEPLSTKDFWCVDATGFNARIASLRRDSLTCQ